MMAWSKVWWPTKPAPTFGRSVFCSSFLLSAGLLLPLFNLTQQLSNTLRGLSGCWQHSLRWGHLWWHLERQVYLGCRRRQLLLLWLLAWWVHCLVLLQPTQQASTTNSIGIDAYRNKNDVSQPCNNLQASSGNTVAKNEKIAISDN